MSEQSRGERRTIVLTGCSRGLGRALVEEFVRAGHVVAGGARTAEGIEALRTTYGAPHDWAVVDVGDEASVAAWAKRVLERVGVPDLLINNAAVINGTGPLWTVSAAEIDRLLRVNVAGSIHVIRHLVPAMIERKRGVIVNLSSGWGRSTAADVGPYCATKYAVEGFTGSLAQELPAGMCATALNPGIIDTDMLRQCFAEGASAYPTPESWAERAAPYLLGLGPKDNGRPTTVPG